MRHRPPAARCAAAALLAAAAACSSDTSTGPDPARFDVAQALRGAELPGGVGAALLGGDPGLVATFAGNAGGGELGSRALRECAWDDAAQAFACAPQTVNGVTVALAYTPLDEAGRPQRTPDRASTAAVRTVTTANGALALPGRDAPAVTLAQRQEATIRGLRSGPRTLDGVTTTSMGLPGAGTMQLTQTTAGVVLPQAGATWPSAGTVTTETVTPGTPGGGASRVVMTFNGTSTVALVLTQGGVTRRCTLDLAPASGRADLVCGD